MKKVHIVISTIVLFIGVFITAATIYQSKQSGEVNRAVLEKVDYLQRDYSPTLGPTEAKVTIIEFFDPACGTCKSFYPFVKQLMAANPGKVNLVVRYLPLHQGSDEVIQILEAARLQNLFWETLAAAYNTQSTWVINHQSDANKLWMRLGGVGLDMKQLRQDMQRSEISERIQQDLADAQQLQISKTPGFFVNDKPLIQFGAQQLQDLVESEIDRYY
jgi:protein-disulfide isomerase